jgi:hypothetical protein
MKNIKLIFSFVLLLAVTISCSIPDGIDQDLSFLNSADAPSNVAGFYNVTQDNTGLVTITPNGEGAVSYDIYYGDSTITPVNVMQGHSTTHIYKEGIYSVKIVAIGITGLKTEVTQSLTVSFKAPENLAVVITNDLAISKQVNVTATADFATMFDVYFGEAGNDVPVSANIGETASYTYKTPGTYTIRVVSKSAAIKTTEYSESFVVTAILQPTTSAPTQPSRQAANVISIFSGAYTDVAASNYNPDWGQSGQGSSYALFDLNGDKMLNYIKLSYQGISIGQTIDVSKMEYLHMDVWTADGSKIETSLINGVDGNSTEKPVVSDLTKGEWTSINIPISAYTSQGLSVDKIFQLKFVGTPWAAGTVFIDNLYFYKAPTPAAGLEGTWKMAPEAGALKVGPSAGNGDWWTSNAQAVTDRACFFDDTFVFSSNGSFSNVLGTDTWLEAWQGTADACGTPVAPHDGTAVATYLYDAVAKTITINGKGAYLGLPKANNAGELPNVAVPTSITYNVVLSDNNNTMNLVIETGSGVFWSFKLVRI